MNCKTTADALSRTRTLLQWSLLGLMLALGLPGQADGSNGKHDDDQDVFVENDPRDKDLVKVTHVFKRAKPGGGGGGGGGGAPSPGYKLAPWRWNTALNGGRLEYWLYTSNLSAAGIDPSLTSASLQDGFSVWSEANAKAPVPTQHDDLTSAPPTLPARNDLNQVVWQNLGATSTIAVTYTWYNRKSGYAVEFDMAFNTSYDWSTTGASGAMDVANIAAHEAGHAMGLDHSSSSTALTMYPTAPYGETQKRDLAPGDVAGILARYP